MQELIAIREVISSVDLTAARILLREYADYLNTSIGAQHLCLDAYEKELAELPGLYAPPKGALLLAFVAGDAAGCVALKPLSSARVVTPGEAACEMKRLWMRPQFRGYGLGEHLAQALIQHAQHAGYTAIYLDTIPAAMPQANRLYSKLGFHPVDQYAANPVLAAESALDVHFYRRSLRT